MPRTNNGPRLELNERGVYEIRWTEGRRSKRVSTRTGNLPEAQKIFGGWLLEFQQDGGRLRLPERVTVATVLDRYLADRDASDKVMDKQRLHNAAKRLTAGLGDLLPQELTPQVLADYKAKRRAGVIGRAYKNGNTIGCGDATLRRELSMLSTALARAVKSKLLHADDVPELELPERPGPKDVWLTEEEAQVFLSVADGLSAKAGGRMTRAHRFIVLGLATASRKTAILKLTWHLIDLKARLVRFDQIDRRQTAKRRVPVPIPAWALPLLRRMEAERINEYVLDNPDEIYKELRTVCRHAYKRTGNKKFLKVTPHVLRHTRATHMARAGRSMWEIAGILGDTIETVTKNYLHHAPEHLRDAADSVSYDITEEPQEDVLDA